MHSDALAGFDVRGPARSPANTVTVTGSAVPPGGGGELFLRAVGNPLLTARRWPDPVNAVLNPGAALVDGVTVLLCRVEDRRGISELTVARSPDGVSNWVIDPAPLLSPSAGHPQEAWGVEDPRITRVDELGRWVIAYTAYGPRGPAVALATTRDFTSMQRLGVVRAPEDKNAALLPRRVGGDFVLFHRPVSVIGGAAIFGIFEPLADRIELTEVLAEVAGDVTMPDLRSSERWRETAYEDHEADGQTPAWRTITLERA